VRDEFSPYEDLLKMETVAQAESGLGKLERFLQKNAAGISSSQLRKVYDKIVNANDWKEVAILRPEFAYLIAKQPNVPSMKVLVLADELAKASRDKIEEFKKIMEYIIAYHKFFEFLARRRKSISDVRKDLERDLAPIKIERMLKHQTFSSEEIDTFFGKLERFIRINSKGITSTQMRRLFDQALSAGTIVEIKKLRPYFAYAAARQENDESVRLMLLAMELSYKLEDKEDAIKSFHQTLEMIVSYHKFYETANNWNRGNRYREDSRLQQEVMLEQALKVFGEYSIDDILEQNPSDYRKLQNKWRKFIFDNLEGVKSSQLRRLYDAVLENYEKHNPEESVKKIKLLQPLFHYTVARQNNDKAKRLILLLIELIKKLNRKSIHDFFQLTEDLVAYHNYFESTIENKYLKNQNL
jgi:CRISPR type III-A-associated protein Csm2